MWIGSSNISVEKSLGILYSDSLDHEMLCKECGDIEQFAGFDVAEVRLGF